MIDLNNKTVLVTGGTGSFGRAFLTYALENYPSLARIIIFSRDEYKQHELRTGLSKDKLSFVKFVIGDVRDLPRLTEVMEEEKVDFVCHAAAFKHVSIGEENPGEFMKTNIQGSENVIHACKAAGVKKAVLLSTDKAVNPVSVYGTSKLYAEKLFIAANKKDDATTVFSVIRFGNLLGSRGSVLPLFIQKAREGSIPITDERMNRFHISNSEVVALALFALEYSLGGEVVVPKMKSFKIIDLAKAVDSTCKLELTGAKPGEKFHEELLDESNSKNVIETDYYYIVPPPYKAFSTLDHLKGHNPVKHSRPFVYASDTNFDWLSIEGLRKVIQEELGNDALVASSR